MPPGISPVDLSKAVVAPEGHEKLVIVTDALVHDEQIELAAVAISARVALSSNWTSPHNPADRRPSYSAQWGWLLLGART